MARPNQFNEEQIIDAAFNLLAQKGPQAITARGVAQAINASTAPIYSLFPSIEALYAKVIEHAVSRLIHFTEKKYTTDLFLNIGVGLLEYTKEFPIVFRTLFMDTKEHRGLFEYFTEQNLIQMKKEKSLELFSLEQKKEILNKLTIFTHGLAAMICANLLEDTSTSYFITSLGDAGAAIIGYTAVKDNTMAFFQSLGQSCSPPTST